MPASVGDRRHGNAEPQVICSLGLRRTVIEGRSAMKIDVAAVRKCLEVVRLQTLFREHLGWDKHQAQLDIPVDGDTACLTAVAQKRGFVAFVCPTIPTARPPQDRSPGHQVRPRALRHLRRSSTPATGLALGPPRAGQTDRQPRPPLRRRTIGRSAHPAARPDRRQPGRGRDITCRGCRRPGPRRLRRG